jgi:hypothetical protein
MAISNELMQAKQTLSARLLRAAARGSGRGLQPAMTMAAAASAAGRNVHAVGIGKKIVNGKETDTLGVRLFVTQKIATSAMAPRDLLPSNVDGIPTDIIEAPIAFMAARRRAVAPKVMPAAVAAGATACTDARQQNLRPVVAGISAGHHDVTAGTIGYFCRSTRQGDDPAAVQILSNNHIFANLNRAAEGDAIYQPGSIDGGTSADTIATLKRFVALELDGTTPNAIDGAIGEMSANVSYSVECCMIGVIGGTALATGGMAVRKHGRTTGYAEGVVTDESIDALIAMDQNDPSVVALFQNQMRLVPSGTYPAIGLGGDSGSLVVDAGSQNAVGLYFANPTSGAYGYACHIAEVLAKLEIELL